MAQQMDILNFGGDPSSGLVVASHLSPTRSRSDTSIRFNAKRMKPNTTPSDKNHVLEELDKAKRQLDEVIDLVLQGKPLKLGYGYYNREAKSVCVFKHAEQSKLSDLLKSKIESCFADSVKVEVKELTTNDISSLDFCIHFLHIYHSWIQKLRLLSVLFLYVDSSYLAEHPHKQRILELGLNLFINNLLVSDSEISNVVLKHYKTLLHHYHFSEDVEIFKTLEDMTMMLVKLNVTNKINYEAALIAAIVDDYSQLGREWVKTPETYIHTVLSRMSKEITFFKRCGKSADFCDNLLIKLKWNLIFINFNEVIHNSLPYLLQPENAKQLDMVYKFCRRTMDESSFDSVPILVFEWGNLIARRVNQLLEADNNINLIVSLVELNESFKDVAAAHFNDNNKFEYEIRSAFSKTLNQNRKVNWFIINQLSKYCDSFFKAASKKSVSVPYKTFVANFMTIFKYVNNKNDFLIVYKKELSRRLLLGRNVKQDLEKKLVEAIFEVVGETEDALALQVMFKDLASSREKYSALDFSSDKGIDFSGLILEKKHWPEMPKRDTEIILPARLSSILNEFTDYYHSQDDKAKDHNLDWSNHSLHQLTIVAHFASGDYELTVNLLQAIVIDLFNEQDRYTIEQMVEITGMDNKLLKRVITSLSDKYKILAEQEDSVTFNTQFSDKAKKLRLPLPREKESSSLATEEKKIERSRESEIKSAIVRIMKVETRTSAPVLIRKTIGEVSKKGPVSISDVKIAMESLIAEEFIRREADTTITYIP